MLSYNPKICFVWLTESTLFRQKDDDCIWLVKSWVDLQFVSGINALLFFSCVTSYTEQFRSNRKACCYCTNGELKWPQTTELTLMEAERGERRQRAAWLRQSSSIPVCRLLWRSLLCWWLSANSNQMVVQPPLLPSTVIDCLADGAVSSPPRETLGGVLGFV